MAQHEIETQWMGKMQFNALVNGHSVLLWMHRKGLEEDNGPIQNLLCSLLCRAAQDRISSSILAKKIKPVKN